jgi:hypothetical protein
LAELRIDIPLRDKRRISGLSASVRADPRDRLDDFGTRLNLKKVSSLVAATDHFAFFVIVIANLAIQKTSVQTCRKALPVTIANYT